MAIEPKKYETFYLLRPDISPEEVLTIQSRIEKSVTATGGDIIKSEKWAERDLAYKIENYRTGIYYIAIYNSEHSAVTEIERYFNLSKNNVLRYITVMYDEEDTSSSVSSPAPPPLAEKETTEDISAFSAPQPTQGGDQQ